MADRLEVDMIVEAISKGFEKVSGDIGKTSKASEQATAAIKKQSFSWTELSSQINVVTGALQTVATAAKQAYEFGKAGAQLEYAEYKFNRLAVAIGTTSDVLMTDLRAATGGLISDAGLMAQAGDVMSLGLVKTHGDVVRLSKVMSGLGMDMNQLVLTLANKTTMRFDQLGVAVDGFDERLQTLKDSGMDANAAFTEAFLQQAEMQLDKVGGVADQTIASFMRLEASTENLKAEMQKEFAPVVADVADGLVTYMKYSKETSDSGKSQLQILIGLINAWKNQDQVQKDAAKVTEDTTKKIYAQANAQQVALYQMSQIPGAANAATDAYRKLTQAENDVAAAQKDLSAAQEQWGQSVGKDMAAALKGLEMDAGKYRHALALIDDAMGTNLGTQEDYRTQMMKLAQDFATGKISSAEFQTKLKEMAKAFEPLSESVVKAMGQVDELQAKLDALNGKRVTAYVDVVIGGNQQPTRPPVGQGGKRQYGGPVIGGNAYIVGERGPELFIPHTGGNVKPNSQLTGAPVNITINNNTRAASALAMAMIRTARQSAINATMGG